MESVFDRALFKCGNAEKFQKTFDVIYNVGLVTFWSMAYMNIILCLVVVPHTCETPQKPNNISEYDWKLKYIPTYVDAAGQNEFESCLKYVTPELNNYTKECNKYVYDKTWYEWTVSSENDWVCNKELYIANILAFSKVAEAIGSLLFGWIADIYGRRPTIILSILMLVIGRFTSLLGRNSYVLFLFGCILASLPSWSLPQSTSVISMEMSSPSRLTTMSTLRLISYSTGSALMALLYWWLRDWKILLIVTTVPLIPCLVYSWRMIESPRWLHTRGKNTECVKYLKLIAKVNQKHLDEDIVSEILTAAPTGTCEKVSPKILFTGKRLAINTILQLILWVSISVSYGVLVLQPGETKDGNPFTEFASQSLVEVPSIFLGAWLADNIGRRKTSILSNSLTTVVWFLFTIRVTSIGHMLLEHWLIGTLFMIIGRLTSFLSYYVLNLYGLELYPTCLRQSGMALGNITANGSSAIAPYILYLGRKFDNRVSGAIMIVVTTAGIIASPLLPETLNAKLPETIEEAQNFGLKRRKNDTDHM